MQHVNWLFVARDNLFVSNGLMPSFEFNQSVTNVFDDMLNRSVPFYRNILLQIAEQIKPHPNIVDLGCSIGGLIPFLKESHEEFSYLGIDKSPAMIQKAKQYESKNIQFKEGDIADKLEFDNPTAIVCNLVLQFIDPDKRKGCIQGYFNSLLPGGQLLIVEKVHQEDPELQAMYKRYYHALKRANGYSIEEIENKDRALDGVLITKPVSFYETALKSAGFQAVDMFFKWYNFVGFIAVKS